MDERWGVVSSEGRQVARVRAVTSRTVGKTANRVVKTGDDTYDVTGTLTMRGVAREITLPLTYLGTATDPWGNLRAGFEANTHVPR